jgi:hypothetical protein
MPSRLAHRAASFVAVAAGCEKRAPSRPPDAAQLLHAGRNANGASTCPQK